jgi:hypothetical protein
MTTMMRKNLTKLEVILILLRMYLILLLMTLRVVLGDLVFRFSLMVLMLILIL